MKTILIIYTLLYSQVFADERSTNKLSSISTRNPLINETVSISPVDGHHFNLKAPQTCVVGTEDKENTINPSAKKIKCQYHSEGRKKITVSVCDNNEVYCKQEKYEIQVSNNIRNEPRLKKPLHQSLVKDQNKNKKLLMPKFKTATIAQAKEILNYKKGLLVLVSTEWCPPCNMLKEFLLPTKEFDQLTQNLGLIYVDGDGPSMSEWRKVLNSHYYPSIIILNQQMQVVDILTGYSYIYQFKEFMLQANRNLKDPLIKLQKRIEDRIAGKRMRKLVDIFTNQTSIAVDEKRWLETLSRTGKSDEKFKYLTKFISTDYKADIVRARYEKIDSEQGDTKELETVEEEVLKTPFDGTKFLDDYIFFTVMNKRCQIFLNPQKISKDTKLKSKNLFSDEKCKSYYTSLLKLQNKSLGIILEKLTPSEKTLHKAMHHRNLASLYKNLSLKDNFKQELEKCFDLFNQLETLSPLGAKSRAVGIYRSYCIEHDDTERNLQLVLKLVKNYPYDATFHYKLASLYDNKKQYEMALKAIEKALVYSYGPPWVKAIVKKSKILLKQKKKQAAFKVLQDALGEIVFEKHNNRNYWLETLRNNYEKLKKELKN